MTDAKKTVLFEKHAALAGKAQIVPFAGWMMPLWYKSISEEHQAVRKTAGLFDCTHMAVLQIWGKDAMDFLNLLVTNDVSKLKPGKAQYAYILDTSGNIIDDVIVYCIAGDNFMMVANASNEQKVKDWIGKVQNKTFLIDKKRQVEVADLKNPNYAGARVDMALQGPAAAECLKNIFGTDPAPVPDSCHNSGIQSRCGVDVSGMKSLSFIFAKKNDLDIIITSTGYTGAKVSYELFVHPNKAVKLWDVILEAGKPLGIIPCGLGARDSLRIEAGLPLYGHELAGDFNISPFQAGYGWAVKMQKFGFIGKKAIAEKMNYDTEVARLKFDGGKGVRPIRQLDGVLSEDGICIGHVLSCAAAGGTQIALALIKKEYNSAGKPVGIYYTARNAGHIQQGRKEKVKLGDKLAADIKGMAVERFEKF